MLAAGDVLADLLNTVNTLRRRAAQQGALPHSPSYYRVLGLLSDAGPMRVGDLASSLHMSQPGMTKLVANLDADGYARREHDPADSRVTLVSVTDQGRAELRERTAALAERLLADAAPLGASELRTLTEAADILARHVLGGPDGRAEGDE